MILFFASCNYNEHIIPDTTKKKKHIYIHACNDDDIKKKVGCK